MNGGRITLTTSEQRRLIVLNHLESGALVNAEAAELIGLSVRQLRRLRSTYRERGAAAVSHGNRGWQPHNAVDEALSRRIVQLATTKYSDFNQQHLTEMLAEQEGIRLSRPTVHRILKAAGVPAPRRRRPPRHRRRRDRYPREGLLLQLDASRHDWLEDRGPMLSLLGAIDDASGRVTWASFRARARKGGLQEKIKLRDRISPIPFSRRDLGALSHQASARRLISRRMWRLSTLIGPSVDPPVLALGRPLRKSKL
jgi:transposase